MTTTPPTRERVDALTDDGGAAMTTPHLVCPICYRRHDIDGDCAVDAMTPADDARPVSTPTPDATAALLAEADDFIAEQGDSYFARSFARFAAALRAEHEKGKELDRSNAAVVRQHGELQEEIVRLRERLADAEAFTQKYLTAIAQAIGIDSPLILIAHAESNEENYADILLKLVTASGERLAAFEALAVEAKAVVASGWRCDDWDNVVAKLAALARDDALRAEREKAKELDRSNAAVVRQHGELQDEIVRLRERLTTFAADAKRWRWINERLFLIHDPADSLGPSQSTLCLSPQKPIDTPRPLSPASLVDVCIAALALAPTTTTDADATTNRKEGGR